MDKMKIKKLSETAKIPTRATDGSAGYDLFADISAEIVIIAGATAKIKTGIAIAIPTTNAVGLVYARSGLSSKHGITLMNGVGVIDSDYRGEIHVTVINHSDKSYAIQPNERIAQLVITPIYTPELIEADNLDETARGTGGFGSTGKL